MGNRLTKIIGPTTATGQPRPETTYTYESAGLLVSSTDPLGQTTTYTFDNAKRVVATTYPDSTTEQMLYGTGANAGRVIKSKDRMGMVTTMTSRLVLISEDHCSQSLSAKSRQMIEA